MGHLQFAVQTLVCLSCLQIILLLYFERDTITAYIILPLH